MPPRADLHRHFRSLICTGISRMNSCRSRRVQLVQAEHSVQRERQSGRERVGGREWEGSAEIAKVNPALLLVLIDFHPAVY